MDFNGYELSGEGGTCDGYIIIENEKVYVDFEFKFNISYDCEGYAEISNTIVRDAVVNSVNLVAVLRNNEVWIDAEEIIQAEAGDIMNSEAHARALAEDLACEAHKEARREFNRT